MPRLWLIFAVAICVGLPSASGAQDASPAAGLYQQHCASCHDTPASHAPGRESLAHMSPAGILEALESGTMRIEALSLSPDERRSLAEFLAQKTLPAASEKTAENQVGRCASPAAFHPKAGQPEWNGWGQDPGNRRFQSAAMAGIAARDIPRLKLKWAFGFPGTRSAYSQPSVTGERVFIGSADGIVYSLDARSGCTYWSFKAKAGVRTAPTVGRPRGAATRYLVYFGDLQGTLYALDAANGTLVWNALVESHPLARLSGSPLYHDGRVYVPVSSFEEGSGTDPKYECCKFRGSIVALDAATGKQIWKTYSIEQAPQPTTKNKIGTQLWAPSGGAVWSAPTLDVKRRALYIGTGNSYSVPAAPTTDAIVALDLDTGKLRWSRQATPKDAWGVACIMPDTSNCPENAGPDYDFGSSPILVQTAKDQSLLLAGQKSGVVFALDPDREGRIVWQARVGNGGSLGGVQWGSAADAEKVYVAVSDIAVRPKKVVSASGEETMSFELENPNEGGGLSALRMDTGALAWRNPPPANSCLNRAPCSPSQSSAVSAIPGVVFSGSIDGHLRAYSTQDGKIIWDYDTEQTFQTVNGVTAAGGSLDGPGPTIANGLVYANSGYGTIYGKPGNVLLVFSVAGK